MHYISGMTLVRQWVPVTRFEETLPFLLAAPRRAAEEESGEDGARACFASQAREPKRTRSIARAKQSGEDGSTL